MRMITDPDAVLIDFLEAGPEAKLDHWTRRYPEQARDLARLAERRWAAASEMSEMPADPHIVSLGQEALRAARAAHASPLASLTAAAQARGLDPDAVAERLGLPVAYFWKLHRRLFAPDSVPRALVSALAQTLGRSAAEIAAYLQRPPRLAAGASYRADSAPHVGPREDFLTALQQDPELTEDDRARWLASGSE